MYNLLSPSSPEKILSVSMKILDRIQLENKDDILISLAVLWLTACEKYKIKPNHTLTIADNMRRKTFQGKAKPVLNALEEYMKHEL